MKIAISGPKIAVRRRTRLKDGFAIGFPCRSTGPATALRGFPFFSVASTSGGRSRISSPSSVSMTYSYSWRWSFSRLRRCFLLGI